MNTQSRASSPRFAQNGGRGNWEERGGGRSGGGGFLGILCTVRGGRASADLR